MAKTSENNFTQGRILEPLLRFMLPILFALFLQSMYGAVDLLICGRFGSSADVSGVSTGSMILMTMTNLITSFSMGLTVLLGNQIGMGRKELTGDTTGSGITFFMLIGLGFTIIFLAVPGIIAGLMNAPEEAFTETVSYLRICGGGFLVITAYSLLGSIFRGLGDSKTPLMAVAIACVFNIAGDLFFVAFLGMGAAGAAIATVLAQALSVFISLLIIRKKQLPFHMKKSSLVMDRRIVSKIFRIGLPIALQDLLVGLSFMVIQAIINRYGVTASAGVGVGEKVCGFLMLVPSAFMQAMAAFVAQNIGAGKADRAKKSLWYGVSVSILFGTVMFYAAFFHGDALSAIFTKDAEVVAAAFSYLKAYAIDCLLTCFLFCFIGYFNGTGKTLFVMVQGIIGAFAIRIPVAFLMSSIQPVSLFRIGLATPCATIVQITMCLIAYRIFNRKKPTLTAARQISG